ncbi:MAG: STAS domain-containing protein [Methylococcaceae bacterium]|jgi:anti-anti-sigma regulatory factor|nr:STAS domain-containing protein [Methylococcaceae bacterium]MDZ4155522.1 STAS domain-containing protein [Methylococcales bacterium]MDP2395246.1 STAS domain-containing protein [Methylococcaceae bacterium]MDP3020642.1 STAS domain-containing protein [Methylococcaceae bacterium]MDP3390081.1 STAS domain-containing protein [Methylococcaceae bacterium]
MTTNKNKDVIGFDPLAWLGLETDAVDNEQQAQADEISDDDSSQPDEFVTDQDDVELLSDSTDVDKPLALDDETVDENIDAISSIDADDGDDLGLQIDQDVEVEEHGQEAISLNSDEASVDLGEVNNEQVDAMTEQEELSPIVDLGSTLTIQHAGELHEKLKLSLAMFDEIEINASDVSAIDTASLQLLVALKKDAANLQKQVSIIYPSPRFVESAQLLGLLEILEVTA